MNSNSRKVFKRMQREALKKGLKAIEKIKKAALRHGLEKCKGLCFEILISPNTHYPDVRVSTSDIGKLVALVEAMAWNGIADHNTAYQVTHDWYAVEFPVYEINHDMATQGEMARRAVKFDRKTRKARQKAKKKAKK